MTAEEIIKIIDENFSDPNFNINSLLEKTEIAYSYLYEIFGYNLRISPHVYLENKRLEKALTCICNKKSPLVQIIQHCGFSNLSTFRNTFKRRINKTPSQIREQYNSSDHPQEVLRTYLSYLQHNYSELFTTRLF
jgi:AraC-like DNA-binding protein